MNPISIDRDNLSLVFQRTLRASCEQAFDAWTLPEQIAQWWDPSGARLTRCQIDLRVGGQFVFENAGHSLPFSGVYRSVERPFKLVFEALGAVGTVLFGATEQGTQMQVTICCASREHFEQFLQLGVGADTGRTLDNLVTHLTPVTERQSLG
jgi:uncharacterized protein YndB with AHSA1/START domain